LGLSRATLYRALAAAAEPIASESTGDVAQTGEPVEAKSPVARTSPRALALWEQDRMLGILRSKQFLDMSPPQVYTTLLDEGSYVGSVSTMYRLLRENNEVRERRNQLTHPVYAKPELMAVGPNQVWSWDITKMRGPLKGIYYYLYVILDLFSRCVVGWTVQTCESQEIAEELIRQTCEKQQIEPDQLTIHADRGPSMISKKIRDLLADLGVIKSHSRPHVSNDNPFSEAQFKTMKYRPEYPDRFASIAEARAFCETFFVWYNTMHYHSGIAMVTPEDMHYGRAEAVIAARADVLTAALAAHPERFVRQHPVPQALPSAVWINPPLLSGTVSNGAN
jgi:putative transposase